MSKTFRGRHCHWNSNYFHSLHIHTVMLYQVIQFELFKYYTTVYPDQLKTVQDNEFNRFGSLLTLSQSPIESGIKRRNC